MKLVALLLLIQVPTPAPIDVNAATKTELITIEGITPNIADNIIRDRPYKTVEDVQGAVPRFLFERIRPRITVTSNPRIAVTPSPVTSNPRIAVTPSPVFSNPRIFMTPSPVTPQPQRRSIQVIQGNRIENLRFEAKEKEAQIPSDKSNSPQ
jgi:hypothetical protein